MNFRKTLIAGAIMGSAVAVPLQVHAQALEEIIVTATKRLTSLQDTSVAVSAFTPDTMEQLDINRPADLEALVPSMTWQQSPNRISIRGVGRFDNSLGVSPGVAMYTDGVYNAEDAVLYSNAINVERMEILRGPQGTLYGRNTTGGAINVVSKRPTAEFGGDFRVKVGEDNFLRLDGLVTGPITDDIRYKLYYTSTDYDGWQENINGGPNGRGTDENYAEGQLEWDVTDNFNIWVKYSGSDYNNTPGVGTTEDPYNCLILSAGLGPAASPLECARGVFGQPSDDGSKVDVNDFGHTKLSDSGNLTVQLTYEFEDMTLSYLYGSVKYNWDQDTDYDGTGNPDLQTRLAVGQYQEQESHELQLTGLFDTWSFVLGAYYFEDENEQPYDIYNVPTPAYGPFGTVCTATYSNCWDNPGNTVYFQNGRINNDSWAIFGETTIELTEEWSITAGLRYSVDNYFGEETQLQYIDASLFLGPTYAPVFFPHSYDASFCDAVNGPCFTNDASRNRYTWDNSYEDEYSNTTGKITVDYKPNEDHLIYGMVSTGYKMGGARLGSLEVFQAAAAGSDSNGLFDQEEVTTLELGWKADLLDRSLRTEVIAFFNDYEGMQQTRSYIVESTGIGLSEVVNLDTEMYGVEFSGTYLFSENLMAIFTSSYNHTEVVDDLFVRDYTFNERDEFGEQIPDNVNGNSLYLTPKTKHALSLHYTIPSSIGDFTIGGSYTYMGKRYMGVSNYNSVGSYERLDLQASWTSVDERYQILATVNNALDDFSYNTYGCGADSQGTYMSPDFQIRCGGNPLDPRFAAVQFVAKF